MTEMDSRNNLLICILLVLQISDTTGSKCSDAADSNNLPYIRMCEDGSVTSGRLILDTHKAGETGETTCSCIVDSTSIITISIEHYGNGLNPNTSGCGSEVVASEIISSERYQCNRSPGITFYAIPVTLTWNGTPGGDSKYCFDVTGSPFLQTIFTITCTKPETPMTSLPPPSPSKPPTSTTSTTTTEFTPGGDTSVKRSTDTDETTKSIQMNTPTNKLESSSHFDDKEYVHLPVYALAIIIVSMCLVSLYAMVVTFLYLRRYFISEKRPDNDLGHEIPNEGGYENMPIPPNVDRTYEGLELSQVNFTVNTYEDLGNSGT